MTIPPEHKNYTDIGIRQEAGKRIAGDAVNAEAIVTETEGRMAADSILRRLSADGVIIPKQYVWMTAIGIPALLFSVGVWVATQQSDLRNADRTLTAVQTQLGDMRTAVQRDLGEMHRELVDSNTRLTRIEAQLSNIPTLLPTPTLTPRRP